MLYYRMFMLCYILYYSWAVLVLVVKVVVLVVVVGTLLANALVVWVSGAGGYGSRWRG